MEILESSEMVFSCFINIFRAFSVLQKGGDWNDKYSSLRGVFYFVFIGDNVF